MASNMIVSLTVEQLEALVKNAVSEAISGGNVKAVLSAASSSAKPGKKEKKAKKERDPNAPKKESNNWIKFTTRVRKVLEVSEGKTLGVEVTQFCGELKTRLPLKDEKPDYSAIEDEAIVEAYRSWEKPEHSKQELAGKSKRKGSVSSSEASAPADSESEDKPKEEKKKREWSAEAKASAAAKRAAKKAAKTAAMESDAEEEESETAAVPAPQKATPPPLPAVSQEEEAEDDFQGWEHKGKSYYKNKKGWVITEEMAWVGLYNEKTKILNTKAPKPEELDLDV